MNPYAETPRWRIFWGLASALPCLGLFLGSTLTTAAGPDKPLPVQPPSRQTLNGGPSLTDRSVYQLSSVWTNDAGKALRLSQLRGKPQVVTMFFASCQGACPLLVHQMLDVAGSLPPTARTNVGFVLVTFDTELDTLSALHDYRASRKLAETQWTLLRGNPEDTRELALVLGVKYRKDARGQFSHSNLITILNAEGEIVLQQTGLNQPPEELVRKLDQLLKR
jgi:protein SCO1/2